MKNKLFLFALLLAFIGCESDAPEQNASMNPVKKALLTGKVQKGPFVEGTSVYIFSLDENFKQTGTSFVTSIVDKKGSFEQKDIQSPSPFVELVATGYYYNEVKGELSAAPLTLSAIADISSAEKVNINILTTLERERILYLVNNGSGFRDAQKQAHQEVLAIFGMQSSEINDAITLDIEANPQLLVISALVQGYLPTAKVTQLLANIASDLRTDGKLDNMEIASALKNNSMGLKADKLVQNMAAYDLAYSYEQSDIEKFLDLFNANTSYQQTEFVSYPEEDVYGKNILTLDRVQANQSYSFAAVTPEWGSLKIEIRGRGEWYMEVMPAAPQNWKYNTFANNDGYNKQLFYVPNPGEKSVLKFTPGTQKAWNYTPSKNAPAENTIHLIFYENSDKPTREKIIQVVN